ncbi:MAG: hypothetical protein WCT36_04660 [Candidatus Gracilibacteria bacterium]|jgi:hypothetical protein
MSEGKNEFGRADIFGAGEYLQRDDESMLFDTADLETFGDITRILDDSGRFRVEERERFNEIGAAVVVGKRLHALHDALALVDSGKRRDGKVGEVLTRQIQEENAVVLRDLHNAAGQWVFDLMEEEASGPGDLSVTHPETAEAGAAMLRAEMDENAKGGHRGKDGGILIF